jgi:uncharacterized protein (TIGR00255 family)
MSELKEQPGLASMTGFARGQGVLSERLQAAVVIRSVNHRYLDVAIRHGMREELPELESVVREAVAVRVRRGRVTVQIRLRLEGSLETSVRVEEQAVRSLAQQLEGLDLMGVGSEVRLGEVLAIPSLVRVEEGDLGMTPAELAALRELLDSVVGDFDAMRRREGESLRPQLESELAAVEAFGSWVGERVADLQERLVEKLSERIKRVVGDVAEPDPDRLLTEAALAADRADVSEELVRLESHTAELRARLGQGGVVGKVLDFLCQELNRELNTIGSKARDAGIAARLVDAKAAVERLREQVQNLE